MENGPDLSAVKPNSKVALVGDSVSDVEACFTKATEASSSVQEVLPGVFYIDHVISEEECNSLIQFIDSSSSLSFWSESGREDDKARQFRDADTIEFQSSVISQLLWSRTQQALATASLPLFNIEFSENEYDEQGSSDGRWQVDLVGRWNVCGLNDDMLFAKYPSHGAFAPHTDGTAIADFNTRSFFSVVIFLNSVPKGCGAGTKFYEHTSCNELVLENNRWTGNENKLLSEVDAVAGRFLFFDQRLMHEGVPPASPYLKYIIRSDIMFRRTPELCTGENDIAAFHLYREAEVLSEAGQTEEAVMLFKRAFKMSPQFARIMQQA